MENCPQSQTIVLKNAPLEDKGFQDFLSQICHGLPSVTVNGEPCVLPTSLRFVRYNGYTDQETDFLTTHLSYKAKPKTPTILVNSSTFEHCFSSVYPDPTSGQLIQTKGILDFLSYTGGTIKISGTVSETRMQKLRFAVANHNASNRTRPIAIQSVYKQTRCDKSQAALFETGHDIHKIVHAIRQAGIQETGHDHIVIDIGVTTKPEDLIQHWHVQSFDQHRYTAVDSKLKEVLDSGHRVLLRGLESNEECLKHLETLFEEPPYLLVNGRLYNYRPDQIVAVFKTTPSFLEKKTHPPFIFNISDYENHFKPRLPVQLASNTRLFKQLHELSKKLDPYLKPLGHDSLINLSFLETIFIVAETQRMSEALIQVIATRFRSDESQFTAVKNLIKSYFPPNRFALSIEIPDQTLSDLKLSSLMDAVFKFPITLIEGAPGSSKTYWAEHVPELLNGRIQNATWSISVGPDADPDILIGKQEQQDDRLVFREGPIMKWANYTPPDNYTYPTLVINEANLAPEEFWNFLRGLKECPPCVDIGPKKIILTPNHRVILTQNASSMVGRNLHADLAAMAYPLYFQEEDPKELMETLVRPLLNKRGLTEKPQQDHAIRTIMEQMHNHISIRDCLDAAEVVANTTMDNISDFGTVFRRLKAMDKTFDFDNPSTFQLVGQIWYRLNLALKTPEFVGKRGMLIEGPPGRGKDATLDRVLALLDPKTRIRRITCKVGADYFEMADSIREAKENGEILIISELNLLPSSIAEGLLNDALTGKAKEGFFLFLTANSGRNLFSDAFKNRVFCHTVSDYSKDDLLSLATQKIATQIEYSQATIFAQDLINFHFKLLEMLSKNGIDIKPTSRELLTSIDELALQQAWHSLEQVLDHTYGLFLIRLNLPTFKPWFKVDVSVLPQNPVSTSPVSLLQDIQEKSDANPTQDVQASTSSKPIMAADSRQSLDSNHIEPQSLSAASESKSPPNDEEQKSQPSPIKTENPFAPLKARPIDYNGVSTQTQATIDREATYFRGHPEVEKRVYDKREYRLYTYDHVTDDISIGQCKTHSFSKISPRVYPPGHEFQIETKQHYIGRVPIPASQTPTLAPIPSLSPYEKIQGYSTSDGQPLSFFTDSHTGFILVQLPENATELTYLLHIPEKNPYVYVDYFEDIHKPAIFNPVVTPERLRQFLNAITIGSLLDITPNDTYATRVTKLVHYCGRFTEGTIPSTYHQHIQDAISNDPSLHCKEVCDLVNLILQKSGVCRHRSWAFLALASYFGIEARLVGNAIHNLVEVHIMTHKGESVWVKVELAQFGFRSQNPNSTELDKEVVQEIQEQFKLQRLLKYPIQNVATQKTNGVRPLEILILSQQHLGPKTRNTELKHYCSHMNKLKRLNPVDISFVMPEDCNTSLMDVVKMAVPTWSDFKLETSRTHVNDTLTFLVNISHKFFDFPDFREPITRFFMAILQEKWDTEQASALMDKLFTMQRPHRNHLNGFVFTKAAFDFFKGSEHRQLFMEKVSTKLFQKILVDARALLSYTDIVSLRGEYFSHKIAKPNSVEETMFSHMLIEPLASNSHTDEIIFTGDATLRDLVQAQDRIIQEFAFRYRKADPTDLVHLARLGSNTCLDADIKFIEKLNCVHELTKQTGTASGPDFSGFHPKIIRNFQFILESTTLDATQKKILLKSLFFDFFKATVPFYRTLEDAHDTSVNSHESKWGIRVRRSFSDFAKHIGLLILKNPEVFDLTPDSQFITYLKRLGDELFDDSTLDAGYHRFLPEQTERWNRKFPEIREDIEEIWRYLNSKIRIRSNRISNEDTPPPTFESAVEKICVAPIDFHSTQRRKCLEHLFSEKVFIDSIAKLREYEQSYIPKLFLSFRYFPGHSLHLIHQYSACLKRFGVESTLAPNVLKWINDAMRCILASSQENPRKIPNVPTNGWGTPFAQNQWIKAIKTEGEIFEIAQLKELLLAPLDMPEGPLKNLFTGTLSLLFNNATHNKTLLVWLRQILESDPRAAEIKQVHKVLLKNYFKTMLSLPLVFEIEIPFQEGIINPTDYTKLLGVLSAKTRQRLLAPIPVQISQQFSFTPSPNIDPLRHTTGHAFFKNPEFTTSPKSVVIAGSIYFDERYTVTHQFAFFTALWQISNHDVTFATLQGSAKPKNFEEFSSLAHGLLNTNLPPIPEYVCQERYPNAIILSDESSSRNSANGDNEVIRFDSQVYHHH